MKNYKLNIPAVACVLLLCLDGCKREELFINNVRERIVYESASSTILYIRFFSNTGISVSTDKFIRSNDGGTTWTSNDLPAGYSANGAYFRDANRGYLFLKDQFNNLKTFSTTNGGNTWTVMAYNFRDIYFVNDLYGFALNGQLYKTSDGGITWNLNTSFTNQNPSADPAYVIALNKDTILISNYFDHELYRSSNGGINWTTYPDPEYKIGKFDIESPSGIYMLTGHGEINKSSDGGITFNYLYSSSSEFTYYDYDFVNNVGIESGTDVLKISRDGGLTWTLYFKGNGLSFAETNTVVTFFNNSTGIAFVGTDHGRIYKINIL